LLVFCPEVDTGPSMIALKLDRVKTPGPKDTVAQDT